MRVRVVRALCIRGERQEPGTVVDLPDLIAREAIYLGKAEPAAETPPVSGPMTTDSVPELVEGKPGRRSKKDAG